MPPAVRRRRLALAAVAGVAMVGGAIVGGGTGDEDGREAAPTTGAPAPACPPEIASDARRLIGQTLVVRMEATATESLRRRVRRGEIGGVALFPPAGADPAALAEQLAGLRRAAAAGGMPPPLIAIDQEGGEVERLPELAPDLSPAELATSGDRAAAVREGRATGRDLRRLGANVDLAPVLDVPASESAFIAPRAFGFDPDRVTALGLAFARGLAEAGVAATAKHFPGLGTATVNTDDAPSTLEATRAQLAVGIDVFEAAIDAGVPLVMVANATYAAYDPERPASLSRPVIEGLLRDRLGFGAVVITDDLGAGALTAAGIDEGEAAVAASRAGADLLLFALSDGSAAAPALLAALRRGGLDRERLEESCARAVGLRERLG